MINQKMILILEARLEHAAREHPEGPSMVALVEEVDEAIYENEKRDKIRLVDELYDVIAVAWRLIEEENCSEDDSCFLDSDWLPD